MPVLTAMSGHRNSPKEVGDARRRGSWGGAWRKFEIGRPDDFEGAGDKIIGDKVRCLLLGKSSLDGADE